MSVRRLRSAFQGHPRGGLFARVAVAALLAACATSRADRLPPGATGESPPDAFAELSNPLATYEAMGFVTGVHDFNAIGRFAYLAGPGDSTLVLFGISLPNSALQFRRADTGYVARYRVTLDFRPDDGAAPSQLSEVQEVRVGSFRETGRQEESVIFQTRKMLIPGDYAAEVEVRDLDSGNGFRDAVKLAVPLLGPRGQGLGDPILVYRVEPRSSVEEAPSLILNPRATIPFGAGSLLVYVEGYGDAETALIEITDAQDQILWSETVPFHAAGPVRNAVLSIVADSLPVGALQLHARVAPGDARSSAPLLVGLSERWLVSNFNEILDLLRYAATGAELDSLRNAPPDQRAERWRTFWRTRDPIAATPENEFFEQYFARIRDANRLFGEQQRAGWLTDRGEVYITLGVPDQVFTSSEIGPGSRIRWLYDRSLGFEIRLDFVDRTGFGDFELT
ncbi:MAG: GWxTD domain-containing protein, partial [Gemmatimonadota bacterium]